VEGWKKVNTFNLPSTSGTTTVRSESSWTGLYLAGSISAALYVILIVVPIVLLLIVPQPPLSDGIALLQYIAAHKSVYLTELVSFVGLSLPALVVFLALYAALERVNSSFAAIGALIGVASETIALAYNSSPPSLSPGLLQLSNQYVAASSEAQRLSLATAAEGLMAVSNAVNAAGILTALGILILSWVMRQDFFWRNAGTLGIVTGVFGIVSEVLRDLIGPGYFLYGILLPAWFVAVGWKLYRLRESGRGVSH
jgi:Domain of unknown function (DUF4386)